MRVIALGTVKNGLSGFIDDAQRDHILITRHGRPVALLIGVEGEEFEDLMTASDPKFWQMIAARRRQSQTISAKEARKRLGLDRRRSKVT